MKNGWNTNNVLVAAILILCLLFSAAGVGQIVTPALGGLITLYSRDSVGHRVCFTDGQYGLVPQNGQVKNRCSDLDFDNHNPLFFTSGIEGARIGGILDVGTEEDLRVKYRYEQNYGAAQGFTSIQLQDGKLYIRKARGEVVQEMSGVEPLFGQLGSSAKAPVKTGHIYILHISDKYQATLNMWVKLMVVSYTEGDSVTFRWQKL